MAKYGVIHNWNGGERRFALGEEVTLEASLYKGEEAVKVIFDDGTEAGFVIKSERALKDLQAQLGEDIKGLSEAKTDDSVGLDTFKVIETSVKACFDGGRSHHCAVIELVEESASTSTSAEVESEGVKVIVKSPSTFEKSLVAELKKAANSAQASGVKEYLNISVKVEGSAATFYLNGSDDSQRVAVGAFGSNDIGAITDVNELKKIVDGGHYIVSAIGMKGSNPVLFIEQDIAAATEAEEASATDAEALKSVVEAGTAKGFVSEASYNERVEYLKYVGFTKESWLNTFFATIFRWEQEDINKPEKTFVPQKDEFGGNAIFDVLMHILCGTKVILEGPKSAGKNVLWETISWLTNMQLEMITMGPETTLEELFGILTTDNSSRDNLSPEGMSALRNVLNQGSNPIDEEKENAVLLDVIKSIGTALTYQMGPVTRWLVNAMNGTYTILVIDEMNLGQAPVISSAFNTLTDDHSGFYEIPGYGKVPISKGLILGATQNGLSYLGTNQQNAATVSRFAKVDVQAPRDILKILEDAMTGASKLDLMKLTKVYSSWWDAFDAGDLTTDEYFNVRGMVRAAKSIALGVTPVKAIWQNVIACGEDEDERELVKELAKQVLSPTA